MLVAMLDLTREKAEQVMRRGPWLASMTEPFRTELLRHAHLQKFAPDQVVYRHGDAVGGMYGLVAGSLTINSAPPDAASRLIHLGMPGAWTGEGPFLTGQPRRVELRALGGAWMMHVPLDALEQMMARDPGVSRAIAMNTVFTVDVLLRIIHDYRNVTSDVESRRCFNGRAGSATCLSRCLKPILVSWRMLHGSRSIRQCSVSLGPAG